MRNTSKNWKTKGTLSISFRVYKVLPKLVPTSLLEKKKATLNSVL